MEALIDCDLLNYCFRDPELRRGLLPQYVGADGDPVYGIPVFELCRALHLAVKHFNVHPRDFKNCWIDVGLACRENGEQTVHVYEYIFDNMPAEALRTAGVEPSQIDNFQCLTASTYWDNFFRLISRMRKLPNFAPIGGWWNAEPPGKELIVIPSGSSSNSDIVLDTNNFIPLLEQLPATGLGFDPEHLVLETRLSESARRSIKQSLATFGASGKLIVPINVLIEADGVIERKNRNNEYLQAREVLDSMKNAWGCGIWNAFDFQPLTQKVFQCFMFLYETLKSESTTEQVWDDFSDMIIIAHGLYNHCRVASNEWFEGNDDVWVPIRTHFPFLVLE